MLLIGGSSSVFSCFSWAIQYEYFGMYFFSNSFLITHNMHINHLSKCYLYTSLSFSLSSSISYSFYFSFSVSLYKNYLSFLIRFASFVYLGNWKFAGHLSPLANQIWLLTVITPYHTSHLSPLPLSPSQCPLNEHSHACIEMDFHYVDSNGKFRFATTQIQ